MDKEYFHLEKLHKQSPHLEENAIRQKIENTKETLMSLERRLDGADASQEKQIRVQMRALENQLDARKEELRQIEREKGAGHA